MRRFGFAVLLLVATTLAYSPAFRAPLIFDDIDSIAGNPSIRQLWPLSVPLRPSANNAASGRPVVNLSLAVNYALADALGVDQGPNSRDPNRTLGFHLVNLLIHVLSGALLFGIVRRTLRSAPLKKARGGAADAVAAIAATLWLLHPIQTEAVNYVIQRTELLVSLFYLATLYCAIRAWDAEAAGDRTRWYVASIAASLLGMASKEVMITVPLVVFLYDRVFRAGSWREAARFRGHRLAYYAALCATALVAVWFIAQGARGRTVGFDVGIPWYRYFYSQGWAIAHYLQLVLWPSLTLDYGTSLVSGAGGVFGATVVGILGVATIVAWRRSPPIGFLGAFFFIVLAPSSSVVPIATEVAAERRVYLALTAVMVGVALAAVRWIRPAWRAWIAAACVPLALLTFQRSALYATPEALWRDATVKAPHNPRAQHNLATTLLHDDPPRLAEAETALRAAIAIDSTYLDAWPNLATVVGAQGRATEERMLLEHVVARDSNYVRALEPLGFLLVGAGDNAAAVRVLERAVAVSPSDESLIALATAYNSLGRKADAVAALRSALQINPSRPDALFYLGAALAGEGNRADARLLFLRALELDPGFAPARQALEVLVRSKGPEH